MNTLLLVSSEVNLIILAILCSEAGWTGSGSGLDELISSNLHITRRMLCIMGRA